MVPLFGQSWAVRMFRETEHDFGVVARGAKVEHRFELQNIYKEDVHIAGVRSSCGCTIPEVTVRHLKTWQKSEIVAVLNTQSFLGQRSATITVTFDKPYYAEVQLQVTAFIRGDVVLEPGMVQFGDVDQGAEAEATVDIAYAGRSDWQVVDVRSAFPHVEVELQETLRRAGNVRYRMRVRLTADAPVGYFSDQLLLVTNESHRGTIPVAIEGRIRAPITLSPSPLLIVPDAAGTLPAKKLLVRSNKPCRVIEVSCQDPGFRFEFAPEASKTTHFITVRYDHAPSQRIDTVIRVVTDSGTGPFTTEVPVTVEALPSDDASQKNGPSP